MRGLLLGLASASDERVRLDRLSALRGRPPGVAVGVLLDSDSCGGSSGSSAASGSGSRRPCAGLGSGSGSVPASGSPSASALAVPSPRSLDLRTQLGLEALEVLGAALLLALLGRRGLGSLARVAGGRQGGGAGVAPLPRAFLLLAQLVVVVIASGPPSQAAGQ